MRSALGPSAARPFASSACRSPARTRPRSGRRRSVLPRPAGAGRRDGSSGWPSTPPARPRPLGPVRSTSSPSAPATRTRRPGATRLGRPRTTPAAPRRRPRTDRLPPSPGAARRGRSRAPRGNRGTGRRPRSRSTRPRPRSRSAARTTSAPTARPHAPAGREPVDLPDGRERPPRRRQGSLVPRVGRTRRAERSAGEHADRPVPPAGVGVHLGGVRLELERVGGRRPGGTGWWAGRRGRGGRRPGGGRRRRRSR